MRQTEPLEDDSPLFEVPFSWLVPQTELKDHRSEEDEPGFRVLLEDPEILLESRSRRGRDVSV